MLNIMHSMVGGMSEVLGTKEIHSKNLVHMLMYPQTIQVHLLR